jgi:competence protein ComEA
MHTAIAAAIVVAALALAPLPARATQADDTARRSAKPAATGSININTASVTDLQNLPGIGARTAGRIVEYRQKNGPFKKVEELMNVRGIGEKNFLKLKAQITVGTPKSASSAAAATAQP